MSGERAAQQARAAGKHGYYVRNPLTQIVVAGPYDWQGAAQDEANARNAGIPIDGDRLEVVLIGPDRASDW